MILDTYLTMFVNISGARKLLNPMDEISWLNPNDKNKPCAMNAPRPDWKKIPTLSKASPMSEEELENEIKALAQKIFLGHENKIKSDEYLQLKTLFISKVSPDRISLYEENKKKLSGNMNAALSYFTADGELVLAYHPNDRWILFTTDEERRRNQVFNDIYETEISLLKKKYKAVFA